MVKRNFVQRVVAWMLVVTMLMLTGTDVWAVQPETTPVQEQTTDPEETGAPEQTEAPETETKEETGTEDATETSAQSETQTERASEKSSEAQSEPETVIETETESETSQRRQSRAERNRTNDFKLDSMYVKMLSGSTVVYESSWTNPGLIQMNETPKFEFKLSFSQKNVGQKDFLAGDYIEFEIVKIKGSTNGLFDNMSQPIDLYHQGVVMGTGQVLTRSNPDGSQTLYYKVTFGANIVNKMDINGTAEGSAQIKNTVKGEIIKVEREGQHMADIEITETPPFGGGHPGPLDPPVQHETLKVVGDTDQSSDTLAWYITMGEFVYKQFEDFHKGLTPNYGDIIIEDELDEYQTFFDIYSGGTTHKGMFVGFSAFLTTYDPQDIKSDGTLDQVYNLYSLGAYFQLAATSEGENKGITYIDPGTTAASQAAAEAHVRATAKTWTVFKGAVSGREKLIINVGAPGSANGLRYRDVYPDGDFDRALAKMQNGINVATQILAAADLAGKTNPDDMLTDPTTYQTLKRSVWERTKRGYQAAYDFYSSNPPIAFFLLDVRTRVLRDKAIEDGVTEVKNKYKVSGSFQEKSGEAERESYWTGTISATAANGDVQIFKADSLYGNSENKTNADPVQGYMSSVQFEVYRASGGAALKFNQVAGKYQYSQFGSLSAIRTRASDGSAIVSNLPPGDYYFKEIAAPGGYYTGQNQKIDFTVSSSSVTYKLANNDPRGVRLTKVKKDDSNTKLPDAKFELYTYTSDIESATKLSQFMLETINGKQYYVYGSGTDPLKTLADGSLTLVKLPAGKYYLKEVEAPDGYRVSDQKYTFELTDQSGQNQEPIVDLGNIENDPEYSAAGDITFAGTKTITGRSFKSEDSFTFELYKVVNGVDMFQKSVTINPTSGQSAPFSFGKINYTEDDIGKSYTYKIVETDGDIDGITYSQQTYTATYKVKDNGDGTLEAEKESGDDLETAAEVVFVNTYEAEGGITFKGTKKITGRQFKTGDTFTFELLKVDGQTETPLDSKTITPESGTEEAFSFTKLDYTQADIGKSYTYKIVETAGNIDGITYSQKSYTGTYKVTDNGDGTLSVDRESGDDLETAAKVLFVNTYGAAGDITFAAAKRMNGRDFQSGDEFIFELYEDKDGSGYPAEPLETVTINPVSGSSADIVFTKIHYTLLDKDSTRKYKIIEKQENAFGILYDAREYQAEYQITDTSNGSLAVTRISGDDLTDGAKTVFTNKKIEASTVLLDVDGETRAAGMIQEGLLASANEVLEDTVAYRNLKPDTKYVAEGTLWLYDDPARKDQAVPYREFEDDGTGEDSGNGAFVRVLKEFTTDATGNGTVKVEFRFNGKNLGKTNFGSYLTAYEEIYEYDAAAPDGKGTLKAAHKDIEDKDQTVFYKRGSSSHLYETSLTVNKEWADNDNKAGLRPDSITVNLYQDKVLYDSQIITAAADGTWGYTWEALPQYDSEYRLYEYEVREQTVEGYTTTYDTATGKIINTLDPIEKDWYIQKTDTGGTALAGAEFTLTDAGGQTARLTTDKDGRAKLPLQPGTYTLTEAKAPKGYALIDKPVTLVVSEGYVLSLGGNVPAHVSLKNNGMEVRVINRKDIPEGNLLEANVKLTKSVDKTTVAVNDIITYTLKVKHIGDEVEITDFEVVDYIPKNTTFVSADNGGEYILEGGRKFVSWRIDSLKPGDSITLKFKVKVNECVTGTKIKNTAILKNDAGDQIDSNEVTTTVTDKGAKPAAASRSGNTRTLTRAVKTGDDSLSLWLLSALLVGSLGIIVLMKKRRS